MNTKVLLAGLVSGITGFLLGWVVYGFALMDFAAAHTTVFEGLMKDPPAIWAIFLSNTAWGMMYAYIFHRYGNVDSFAKGFTSGILISFLIGFGIDMFFFAFMNMYDSTYLMVDIIIGTVLGALMAGVAGAMLGTGKAKA